MLLWNVKILDNDEITEYQKILDGSSGISSEYEFHKE